MTFQVLSLFCVVKLDLGGSYLTYDSLRNTGGLKLQKIKEGGAGNDQNFRCLNFRPEEHLTTLL